MLKGKTKIELTDVKTGQTNVIEKENMVTNAINSLLGDNHCLMHLVSDISSADRLYPIIGKAIGGVLCYRQPLEENADEFYAPLDNQLIACASNNVNDTASTLRGSLNQIESGWLANHNGYRFVWDFTTSQGNGVISSLGLTSAPGGVGSWGESGFVTYSRLFFARQRSSTLADNYFKLPHSISLGAYAINIIAVNSANNESTSVGVYVEPNSSDKLIRIVKMQMLFSSVKLTSNYFKIKEEIELKNEQITAWIENQQYYTFLDDGDYYLGLCAARYERPTPLKWIKIHKETLDITTGEWGSSFNIFYNIFNQMVRSLKSDELHDVSGKNSNIVIKNDLLLFNYIGAKDYSIIVVNKNTGVIVNEFIEPLIIKYDNIDVSTYENLRIKDKFVNSFCSYDENGIIWKHAFDFSNGTRPHGGGDYPYQRLFNTFKVDKSVYGIGVYIDRFAYNRPQFHWGVYTPYLATINNLSEPIVKTADKTMKITYILEEVENG